ncbi:hypothetical protein BGX38DRAFT_411862 [Terfezia claveryi]|nr:hypothetical protein BGX38DRAFT_411862 [Terfezia claveryi]
MPNKTPKATWRYIKRWFEAEYPNKDLTQSQISKILNPKRPRGPSDVDPVQVQKLRPESKRIRAGKYPKLERALYQWQQLMQQRGAAISMRINITRDGCTVLGEDAMCLLYAPVIFVVLFRNFSELHTCLVYARYKHIALRPDDMLVSSVICTVVRIHFPSP